MDKRKSILNVSTSIVSRVLLLVAALLTRRLLIQYIGNDVNGLNSLYTSIIGMLAVAELGVGSAIVFSMYKPILDGNKGKVAALYVLYRKLYRIIGTVIFAAGLVVMLFLPKLISDYEELNVNVYLTFFLVLISVVLSYLYSAKTSLIEAHKDNYITTGILTAASLLRYVLQIAVILIWKSFTIFLLCQILQTLVIWILTEVVVRKRHKDILGMREVLDQNTKAEIGRNIKAMFMHRIGTVMVNTIDSLIISGFIGVTILGMYTNYTLISGVVAGTIALFFSPLTSVIGHLCAAGDSNKTKVYFDKLYCLNYVLGVVFFLGYYAIIDNLITLCFGLGLEMSHAISFVITLNQFTSYMRQVPLLFRDASGTFYNDRWKPIAEGIANLILSLLFVNLFPDDYKVVGVIAATIITTLLICDIVEPYVIFRHVFKGSPRKFYVRSYSYVALFIVCLFAMSFLMRSCDSQIQELFLNGFISVGIAVVALSALSIFDKKFRHELFGWFNTAKGWFMRHR